MTIREINCAYSHVRRRFIRGCRTGFIRGVMLDDHPLNAETPLVTDMRWDPLVSQTRLPASR
jgi:hypothetical protein